MALSMASVVTTSTRLIGTVTAMRVRVAAQIRVQIREQEIRPRRILAAVTVVAVRAAVLVRRVAAGRRVVVEATLGVVLVVAAVGVAVVVAEDVLVEVGLLLLLPLLRVLRLRPAVLLLILGSRILPGAVA